MSKVLSTHAVSVDGYITGGLAMIGADTGFAPAFDATTAVADYVEWFANNPR